MYTIVVHGGAGVADRENLTDEMRKRYLAGINDAVEAGYNILRNGGSALSAVEASVISLEDNELFNAGKGSVFTSDFTHELEAAIMEGKEMRAGAACGLRNVRNPIILARNILEKSPYIFMNGKGAEKFAREINLRFEPDNYFFSSEKYEKLQEEKFQLSKGTVGAVALDSEGNLAAATSTGGLTNKNYGRIGDSPLIGAGTYANNNTCAVSCTGDGEYFIRSVAAYDVSCLIEYKQLSLREACSTAIKKLTDMGGDGGLIAVDKNGNIELAFNSNGMYRGFRTEGSEPVCEIY